MNSLTRAVVVLIALCAMALARAEEPAAPAAPKAPAKAVKVDINSAPEDALHKLPGITPARAKAIVEGRCYETLDELVDRRILPGAVYEKIKEQLVVAPPSAKDRQCVTAPPAAGDSKAPKK
jgi:DNA uptake protein ComE-like DNA-binding protein